MSRGKQELQNNQEKKKDEIKGIIYKELLQKGVYLHEDDRVI